MICFAFNLLSATENVDAERLDRGGRFVGWDGEEEEEEEEEDEEGEEEDLVCPY